MPISPEMPSGPDHTTPTFFQYARLEDNGWAATQVTLSSHLGTHLDAPSHFIAGAATVEKLTFEVFTGPAQVIHLSGHGPIDLDAIGAITSDRVLIDTGWSRRFGDEKSYFEDHPYLTDEVGEHLVRSGARLVGIDTPSVDHHPPSAVHLALLGAGAVIVENLINLDQLGSSCEFIVLPLPLVGVDGSPVRAIARSHVVTTSERGHHDC